MRERPPRRRWPRWLAVAVVVVVGLVAAANLYLLRAAAALTAANVDSAPVRPYAIVLGNRVFEDGIPFAGAGRPPGDWRLALHRAGRAEKLVVSGRVAGAYDEPHAMARWLEARGVVAGNIVVDMGGHRTAATMAGSAALGVRSALVVSQGYHLPRALYLARHAGIDAIGVPAVTRGARAGGRRQGSCGRRRRARRPCSRLPSAACTEPHPNAPGARCKCHRAWLETRVMRSAPLWLKTAIPLCVALLACVEQDDDKPTAEDHGGRQAEHPDHGADPEVRGQRRSRRQGGLPRASTSTTSRSSRARTSR